MKRMIIAWALLGSVFTTQALALTHTVGSTAGCNTIQGCIDNIALNGDTIAIPAGIFYENLFIQKHLTLLGAGAAVTEINGSGSARVVLITGGNTVTITGVKLTDGAAILGAGILNYGDLTLMHSIISGNIAGQYGGGGIINASSGTLNIAYSTISGNLAGLEGGGGIRNYNTLTLTNSTISGNITNGSGFGGGGILNQNGGTINITNSTISGNQTSFLGGGLSNNSGTITLRNSTISGNTAGILGDGLFSAQGGSVTIVDSILDGECGQGQLNTLGHNLFFPDPACGFVAADGSDIVNVDPVLGPLADNGGPTFTHLPGELSPAIDAGDCDGGNTTDDQRGVARPQGPSCDIGAVEVAMGVGVDDGCVEGNDGTDIFTVAASSDGADIEVVVTLCGPLEPKTKIRVLYDYEAGLFDDPDRNNDQAVDASDFCYPTSDDGQMLAINGGGGLKATGPSTNEIPIDVVDPEGAMPVLTYTVKYSDLDGANDDVVLGTGDIIAIWVDTQDKGIPDRAPNTDDTNGCTAPETSEEVIVLELE